MGKVLRKKMKMKYGLRYDFAAEENDGTGFMKIIEGIKMSGSPYEIPDCGRNDLPGFFVEMGYKVGAEIGVLTGDFTEKLCQAGLKVYGIDPWGEYTNYHRCSKEIYENDYAVTKERLAPYDCTLIRKVSMDAVSDFKDNSLDFVYIDGNHTIRYVVGDIYEWNRKVRVGGVISGHDFGLNYKVPYSMQALHVRHAIDIMIKVLSISSYYVLGEYHPKKGEKRDKWRSWMWIKK